MHLRAGPGTAVAIVSIQRGQKTLSMQSDICAMAGLCKPRLANFDFHENHRMSGAVDDIVLHANGARVGLPSHQGHDV